MKKLFISLALAMMLMAVMVAPALADTSDTTDVTGNVTGTIDVAAPSTIALGDMAPSATAYTGNSTDGLVKANAAWQVTAKDEKGSNTGYMVSGTDVLGNEMEISDDDITYYKASGSPSTLTYSGSATGETGTAISLYVEQLVDFDDPVANGYTITITFTGSLT